ncbi:MAG: PD-(D/E)XK nuclease family protein [Methylococcaceae bacterium]
MNSLTQPNLFKFATSELSQDAFICWLLSWENPEYQSVDANLHQCGMELVKALAQKSENFPKEIIDIQAIEVIRQYSFAHKPKTKQKRSIIDILCVVNGKFVFIIEDKTNTKDDRDQLKRYLDEIKTNGIKTNRINVKACEEINIVPIYFKTYDQSNYETIKACGFEAFPRNEFLTILNKGNAIGVTNSIFQDFRLHLQAIEDAVNSYEKLKINEWKGDLVWTGFFLNLQRELDKGDWRKVNNVAGGFMGFWWGIGCQVYLQLQNERLCFKINLTKLKGDEKSINVRNKW